MCELNQVDMRGVEQLFRSRERECIVWGLWSWCKHGNMVTYMFSWECNESHLIKLAVDAVEISALHGLQYLRIKAV